MQFNATVELGKDDVEKILKEALVKMMPTMTIKSIKFDATMSYGPFDHGSGTPVFSGVKVTVSPKGTEF